MSIRYDVAITETDPVPRLPQAVTGLIATYTGFAISSNIFGSAYEISLILMNPLSRYIDAQIMAAYVAGFGLTLDLNETFLDLIESH
jgi:hypothetical protein